MKQQTKLAGLIGTLVIFATAAFPAVAQNTFVTQEQIWSAPMMKMMDKNKDGMVSRDEFLSYMGAQYDMMDVNKDKKLSKAEFMDKKMMMVTFTLQSE